MTGDLLTPHMQIFAVVVLVAFLGWVTNLVRRHRLSLRDSLIWLLSTFAALVVTAFPQLLVWTARALQVEVPANALFTLTFLYVLGNLLSITIAVSTSSASVRRLTQECALLRAELHRLEQSMKSASPVDGEPSAAPAAHKEGASR
jgi:hypothetical protein